MAYELNDDQIDVLLERFDDTDPKLQRRIIAKFVGDREVLYAALVEIAELDGDCEQQDFKLTRFQASQVAREALNAIR